jgi:hypothetical protein
LNPLCLLWLGWVVKEFKGKRYNYELCVCTMSWNECVFDIKVSLTKSHYIFAKITLCSFKKNNDVTMILTNLPKYQIHTQAMWWVVIMEIQLRENRDNYELCICNMVCNYCLFDVLVSLTKSHRNFVKTILCRIRIVSNVTPTLMFTLNYVVVLNYYRRRRVCIVFGVRV